MKGKRSLWIYVLSLVLVLAACGGQSADEAAEPEAPAVEVVPGGDDTMSDAEEVPAADEGERAGAENDDGTTDEMAEEESDAGEAVAEAEEGELAGAEHDDGAMDEMTEEESDAGEAMAEAPADVPAWMTHSLTNAVTGESFTLADFAGKTVFVEPMATWCTNCRRQLTDVKVAQANFDPEEVVIVGLSVETNLSDQDLALFATQADFNWTWSVATPELLRDLVATFGQSVTNAPATPHFIIRPDGSFTELDTGFESPDELTAQIEAARQG